MSQNQNHGIETLVTFAIQSIRSVGKVAMDDFGKGKGTVKFDEWLVTHAELQIGERFRHAVESQYPDHLIFTNKTLDTDYTHDSRRYLWIFDPIDGVDNYQAGIPIWGMSVALLENFWPVFGAYYMPATGDLFHARAGGDAYWGKNRIHMPHDGTIDDESLLFTFSRFHQHYLSRFPGKIRNLGCTGAHLCFVAMGRADAAITANESFRDLAATRMIVESAGGQIYKTSGQRFYLNEHLNGERIEDHLLVSAPSQWEAVLDTLERRL